MLARVAQNDRAAFEAVYRATHRKLYGIILGLLHNRSLADDILQDVYVKIWQRAATFDAGRSSPITWMAVIARNRALDEVRRATPTLVDVHEEAAQFAAELDHPLDGAERSDAFRALMRCLSTLDQERRDILLLAYYRGLSRDALAARFQHPAATIKTWLHRSLAQLRGCLAS